MTSGDGASGDDQPMSLASKLRRLLDVHRRPDGKKFTLRDLEAAIPAATADDPEGPVSVSYSYLSQLLSGARTNPTADVLRGLIRFFDVPPAYFLGRLDEVDDVEADLDLREAMRVTGVREIAVRAAKLSPAQKRALAAFLSHLEDPPSS